MPTATSPLEIDPADLRSTPEKYEEVRTAFIEELEKQRNNNAKTFLRIDVLADLLIQHPGLLANEEFLSRINFGKDYDKWMTVGALGQKLKDLKTNPDTKYLIANNLNFLSETEKTALELSTNPDDVNQFINKIGDTIDKALLSRAETDIKNNGDLDKLGRMLNHFPHLWKGMVNDKKNRSVTLAEFWLTSGKPKEQLQKALDRPDLANAENFLKEGIGAAEAQSIKDTIGAAQKTSNAKVKKRNLIIGAGGIAAIAGITALVISSLNTSSTGSNPAGNKKLAVSQGTGKNNLTNNKTASGNNTNSAATNGKTGAPANPAAGTGQTPNNASGNAAKPAGNNNGAAKPAAATKSKAKNSLNGIVPLPQTERKLLVNLKPAVSPGIYTLDKSNAPEWMLTLAADYWSTTDEKAQENHPWKKLQKESPEFAKAARRWAEYVKQSGDKKTWDQKNVYHPAAREASAKALEDILEINEIKLTNSDICDVVETLNKKKPNSVDTTMRERGTHLIDEAAAKAVATNTADPANHGNALFSHIKENYPELMDAFTNSKLPIKKIQLHPAGYAALMETGETIVVGNGFFEVHHSSDKLPSQTLALFRDIMLKRPEAKCSGKCEPQVTAAVNAAKQAQQRQTAAPAP